MIRPLIRAVRATVSPIHTARQRVDEARRMFDGDPSNENCQRVRDAARALDAARREVSGG